MQNERKSNKRRKWKGFWKQKIFEIFFGYSFDLIRYTNKRLKNTRRTITDFLN